MRQFFFCLGVCEKMILQEFITLDICVKGGKFGQKFARFRKERGKDMRSSADLVI